jgi:arylsulfatase A-like enzyme
MENNKKPNILFIFTDQQYAGMLGCEDNPYVKTPNLDQLANNGARLERAYCNNPVCVPSRFSMMTGIYPSTIKMETNDHIGNIVPGEILSHSMGVLLGKSGYQTVYGGKTHLPGPEGVINDVTPYGFDYLTNNERAGLAEACADFIKQPHEKPFLLTASFINPHDICYMAINDYYKKKHQDPIGGEAWDCLQEALEIPKGINEETFFNSYCPPLPDNFEIPESELSAFMADRLDFMYYVRDEWDERMWRLHRWAYAKLTERVDSEIGIVLDSLSPTFGRLGLKNTKNHFSNPETRHLGGVISKN